MIPPFVIQSELKGGNTAVNPAADLSSDNSDIPAESSKISTWDGFARGVLKNLNQLLIELEINAFWYKDFIIFDYFEFLF